jgi:hypothetical protein
MREKIRAPEWVSALIWRPARCGDELVYRNNGCGLIAFPTLVKKLRANTFLLGDEGPAPARRRLARGSMQPRAVRDLVFRLSQDARARNR